MEFEAKIIEFLQSNASVGWIETFSLITMLGSYLGFLFAFIILFYHRKGLALTMTATFILGGVINTILKLLFVRARPFNAYDEILNLGNEGGYSMPSGHSMNSAIFASFLIYALIKSSSSKSTKVWGCIAIGLVPALVAFSRMILGVHYLTDTCVGILVGILFAIIALKSYQKVCKKIEKFIRGNGDKNE